MLYADTVYAKAQGDFDEWLKQNNLPGQRPRRDPRHVDDDVSPGSREASERLHATRPVAGFGDGAESADPNAPRPVASGVSGDGRPSDVKYGKMAMDIKIDYAVKQIQEFLKSVGAK